MSKKLSNELRTLSTEDLKQKVLDLRKEQFILRLKKSDDVMGKQMNRIREVRRQIARVKTILTEKERAGHE